MKLIMLTGPKGSGKDASYEILKSEKLVNGKLSFAGPLKEICSDIFGLHHNFLNDPILKEKDLKTPIILTRKLINRVKWKMHEYVDPTGEDFYNIHTGTIQDIQDRTIQTPRELLQLVGTEVIRNIYPDWHTKAFMSETYLKDKKITKTGTYTITDCRFPNEYSIIKNKFKNDVIVAYVERPESEEQVAKASHASEREVLEVKKLIQADNGIIIQNKGSLQDLKKTLLKEFKK